MNKSELIEKLYKDGKITFAEAMVLSNNSSPNLKVEDFPMTMIEGAKIGRENIRKQIIDNFIKEIINEHYDPEEPDKNLAFDSKKCVEAMDANDWSWHDTGVPTKDQFKDHLRDSIKRVIESSLRKYREKNNQENDYYSGEECGGIKTSCWITPDQNENPELEVKCEFILEQGEYILENKKLKEIL